MEKSSVSTVPVIDMQNFPGKYEKVLKETCEEWGCFRLVNHSIPISLMSGMKAVVSSVLDLPVEISQSNPLYEALGLYDIGSSQAVQQFCSQLGVSDHQRSVIEAYAQAINDLALEISEKLAKAMGLRGYSFEGWPMLFRINKYNFTPESLGTVGVQFHTDAVFLTILQDDENIGGLEVINRKSGEYVAVDPFPGGIVVNFGDVGTAWSNGRFCNVKHRVQCKEASTRLTHYCFFCYGTKGGSGGGTGGVGGRSASETLRSFYVGRVQEAPIHRQVSDY